MRSLLELEAVIFSAPAEGSPHSVVPAAGAAAAVAEAAAAALDARAEVGRTASAPEPGLRSSSPEEAGRPGRRVSGLGTAAAAVAATSGPSLGTALLRGCAGGLTPSPSPSEEKLSA